MNKEYEEVATRLKASVKEMLALQSQAICSLLPHATPKDLLDIVDTVNSQTQMTCLLGSRLHQ